MEKRGEKSIRGGEKLKRNEEKQEQKSKKKEQSEWTIKRRGGIYRIIEAGKVH